MQRFRDRDGTAFAFSNGAMWTVYSACHSAAAERRPPETAEEDAVIGWLRSYWAARHGYAVAFTLDPVEAGIATPRRLAYLAELLRLLADDLAQGGAPDADIWQGEVAWEPARRAHWRERLDALARMVEAARSAMVDAPRAPGDPVSRLMPPLTA